MKFEKEEFFIKKYQTALDSFFPLLKVILNDKDIDSSNFEKKIKEFKKSKEITDFSSKVLELFVYLNPKKENFKNELNRCLIINILKYLVSDENNKIFNEKEKSAQDEIAKLEEREINEEEKNDEERNRIIEKVNPYKIFEIYVKVYEDDPLFKILFNEDDKNIITNIEQYIEIFLLFTPEKDISQIIKTFNNIFKDDKNNEIIMELEKILGKINLQTEIGFKFLKDIVLLFIKDKNTIIKSIKEIETKYIINNNMLRCIECFNLPSFIINPDNKINICYKCEHFKFEEYDLKQIQNYTFKCDCNEILLAPNKNFICSNCKHIYCSKCSKKHFEKCATIFFIPLNELDNICCIHKEKFEYYCDLCDINICKKCFLEHFHYVEKYNSKLDEQQLYNLIKEDNKNDKILLSCIESILNNNNYSNNFQFIHFCEQILGNKTTIKSKLFDEFYGEEFNDYYNYIISQANLGNYYYLEILNNIKTKYKGKRINGNYVYFICESISIINQKLQLMNSNNMKYALINRYFHKYNDIEFENQLLNYKSEIEQNFINNEENKIMIKCLLNSESLYKEELLKLMNRSISESILFYLIEKFPNNFRKINMNLKIYSDLEKYYKNEPEKYSKLKINNKDKINELLNNNIEDSNDDNNIICFENNIKIQNTLIKVDELNQMLKFLFFKKENGNFTADPKNLENNINVIISPDELKTIKSNKNKDIPKEVEIIKNLLEQDFVKRYFIIPINQKLMLDCLFDNNKFKDLINSEYNDNKIDTLLSDILGNIDIKKDVQKDLEKYGETIGELEEIYSSFKNLVNSNFKIPPILNEFFGRLKSLLNSGEKCLNLLCIINHNHYNNSVTGDSNNFFGKCLDYIIINIKKIIEQKIINFKNTKKQLEELSESRKTIISLLRELNERLLKPDDFNRPSNNSIDEINEYINKENEKDKNQNIDLKKIRNVLEKLITGKIDWTKSKKCSLSAFLFLKQNEH